MHDKNGKPLKEGDTVSVLFTIKSVSADQDYCNITPDTVEVMPGNGSRSCLTLNAKQVELVAPESPAT